VIVVLTRTKLEKFGFLIGVLVTTIAVAIIALVQAAGVSSSVPNPDGEYPDPSGDFRGQGIANGAVGVFGGVPVGGSLSGTILIQNLGGRNRSANISTGVFALVAILLIAPFIERTPMPTLAGLLMVIGFSMINRDRIVTVWHTGRASSAVMVLTFIPALADEPALTGREAHVLRLLAKRYTNVEIARELLIAPATVKKHTVTLYDKLNVHSRSERVAKALTLGYVNA